MEENNCNFVSSRGILKSCDIFSKTPISSINRVYHYDFNGLQNGSIIYICANAIPHFVYMFNQIKCKIILVTGDCDESCPNDLFFNKEEFLKFIENDNIIHWFTQNCVLKHPKLTSIPIGLDYHTLFVNNNHEWGEQMSPKQQEEMLINIKNNSKVFYEREIKCYSNFHFFMKTRFGYDRKDAYFSIDENLVYYEDHKVKREESWKKQSKFTFVISPHGNGLDCHRTWEALCLGCIPIVKTSHLNILYEDLPVLIVNNWEEITQELLNKTILEYKDKEFKYEKLTLKYWINKIKEKCI